MRSEEIGKVEKLERDAARGTTFINLLKPAGYVMHHQFNIQQLCPHCIYVFCIYLRTNSDLCHLQHKLIGFYNGDEKCLQRGTDRVFKYSSLRFVFKWLIIARGFKKPHLPEGFQAVPMRRSDSSRPATW
jgi:hypothetical protein